MIYLPKKEYSGVIKIPGSKSDTHRALIAASLVKKGVTKISNVYFSDDIQSTIYCLKTLGATFSIEGSTVYVKGMSLSFSTPTLHCKDSASTLRFLLPLVTHFSDEATFVCTGNLSFRPQSIYENIFELRKKDNNIKSKGKITNNIFNIDGSISSQFISGMLFVLPLLENDSIIYLENTVASLSYILMTIDTLKKFNVSINFDIEKKIIRIKGNQEYVATSYEIEGDYSSSSFFLALGALNNEISVEGLNPCSLQPDKNIVNILKELGVNISIDKNKITTKKSQIKNTTISLNQYPDLGPILIGLSCFSDEDITFTNTSRLQIKESNRLEAMKDNLNKLGIELEVINNDTFIVHHNKLKQPNEILSSYNDHRIFMTLAIITYNLDVYIDDELCVKKSYPTFLEDLKSLEK